MGFLRPDSSEERFQRASEGGTETKIGGLLPTMSCNFVIFLCYFDIVVFVGRKALEAGCFMSIF